MIASRIGYPIGVGIGYPIGYPNRGANRGRDRDGTNPPSRPDPSPRYLWSRSLVSVAKSSSNGSVRTRARENGS